MGTRNGIDERKSESVSVGLLALYTPLKRMLQDILVEAWPVVFNNQLCIAVFSAQLDTH